MSGTGKSSVNHRDAVPTTFFKLAKIDGVDAPHGIAVCQGSGVKTRCRGDVHDECCHDWGRYCEECFPIPRR